MSPVFPYIAKHLRPGLYLLAKPVLLESASNFWTGRDARQGDCDAGEVDTPIIYRLHAVLIVNAHEWHGFDEPTGPFTVENAAVGFVPGDLSAAQLVCFLRDARRVSGTGRRRRPALVQGKGGVSS